METEPSASTGSTPPETASEEPVTAVPTSETTPVWAHTVPVEPAENSAGATVSTDDEEALPALPMQKGDPDWSKTQSSANGESAGTTPGWATTVPTAPDEPIPEIQASATAEPVDATEPVDAEEPVDVDEPMAAAEPSAVVEPAEGRGRKTAGPVAAERPAVTSLTEPLKAVAGDAMKSTWPPAAESAPAPPQETDIWPPEPPTERAMPAWPPPSELEEPSTPAQVIPSWPDSFAPATEEPTLPAPAAKALAPEPKAIAPEPKAIAPESKATAPEPKSVAPESTPLEPAPKAVAPEPEPDPVAPAQSGPPARPAWAPSPKAQPATQAPRAQGPAPLPVPAWAPRVPLAAEPGTPTWFSPKEEIHHTTAQPAAQPAPSPAPKPTPAPPAGGGQLPVAQIPAMPVAPAKPAQPGAAQSTWEVVEQKSKSGPHAKAEPGPTAEDRSYAEWFAWAKRGGAPASACHAAAQGAFKALSGGKDVATAVQWATAAMSRPPENVSYARQTYCAWFSLANIDLNLDQHRAHAFATAAIRALDTGQDASAAHAAGLVAAGIK